MGRRWRRRQKVLLSSLLITVALIAVTGVILFERTMAPAAAAVALRRAEAEAVAAISRALSEKVAEPLRYDDLVRVERDDQGRITFMQVNTGTANEMVAGIQSSVQSELASLSGAAFRLPLGLLMESTLLAAHGPRIKVRMIPMGNVHVMIHQSFDHAGINQTRHTLSIDVEARVQVAVPLFREETVVRTRAPLVDAVIVGEVPSQYLNFTGETVQPVIPVR